MSKGKVYLIGAGPGDVGLITVKGMEAIRKAEVILYDRLANPKLLEFAVPGCELIYCGKLPHRHILRQEAITDLLVSNALTGKTVIRLKGGDPGVFGRVGEEAEALAQHGIEFEIVPGISSGIAAPLYAGIPVTHRKYGESFAVVTAHDKSLDGKPLLDWPGLASGVDTIAFYMGIANLPFICENLIKNGKPSDTAVILIQWGTFGRQKTLQGTLATIAVQAAAVSFSNPAITLVGNIVSLREKISWFEKKPLFGRQILLARTGTNQSELAKELSDQGADVIEFPKWNKVPAPIDMQILKNLDDYCRILFTSPESITDFFTVLFEAGIDIRSLKAELFGASVKSAKALNEKGFLADTAEKMRPDGRLLLVGDNHLQEQQLAYASSKYGRFDLYITSHKKIDEQFLPIFERMLEEAAVDTVIFPSSLSVKILMQEGINANFIPRELLDRASIVCMGKQTLQAAAEHEIKPKAVLANPTKAALLEHLINSKWG